MTLLQRIESKTYYEPNTGCWLWGGAISANGYGCVLVNGKASSVHRVSYSIHNGIIPDGKLVCHKCDTPSCINPDHLFLGTHQDNMSDMVAKGRHGAPKGQNHGMAKLTERDVVKIRSLLSEGNETQTAIGKRFGVSNNLIHYIKTGKLWSNTAKGVEK